MLFGDLSKLDTALLFVVHYKYTCRSDERWNPLTFCFFSNHGVYYVCILIFFLLLLTLKFIYVIMNFAKKIIYLMFNIYIHLSRKLYTICFIFSVRNNSLTLRYLDIIDFFFNLFLNIFILTFLSTIIFSLFYVCYHMLYLFMKRLNLQYFI